MLFRVLFAILACGLSTNSGSAASPQDSISTNSGTQVPPTMTTVVTEVSIPRATVPDCVGYMCGKLGLRCAIEDIPCSGASKESEAQIVSVHLKNISVADALSSIVSKSPVFEWSADVAGVVHLFPRSTRFDPSYILTRPITHFECKGITFDEATLNLVDAMRKFNPMLSIDQSPDRLTCYVGGDPLLINVERQDTTARQILEILCDKVMMSSEVTTDEIGSDIAAVHADMRWVFSYTLPIPQSVSAASLFLPEISRQNSLAMTGMPADIDLDLRVAEFTAANVSVPECLALLADKFHFCYGIEEIPSGTTSIDDFLSKSNYTFSNMSLGEVFDKLIASNPAYTWEIPNGYARFFPRQSQKVLKYAITTKVPSYAANATTLPAAVDRLIQAEKPILGQVRLTSAATDPAVDADGDIILYNTNRKNASFLSILENTSRPSQPVVGNIACEGSQHIHYPDRQTSNIESVKAIGRHCRCPHFGDCNPTANQMLTDGASITLQGTANATMGSLGLDTVQFNVDGTPVGAPVDFDPAHPTATYSCGTPWVVTAGKHTFTLTANYAEPSGGDIGVDSPGVVAYDAVGLRS